MKLLVLSDSHGCLGNLYDAVEAEMPDMVIHLGDCLRDAEDLSFAFPDLEILRIAGNCDFVYDAQPFVLTEVSGVRILFTHGHPFGVKRDLGALFSKALECGAQLALFGHTHVQHLEHRQGVCLLNPGACGRSSHPGYAVIDIAPTGSFTCQLKQFD